MAVDNDVIEASPTKELFVYMLVRDIPLIRAIIDLVDNSVDGAIRGSENEDYSNYWIRIEISKDDFRITDNCGGIPVEVARNYAFRFGRPVEAIETPHSIGQFGVGMKRTLFKLGKEFVVESSTENSNFKIDVDVESWKQDSEWHFFFSELNENLTEVKPELIGTKIEIKELYKGVSNNFGLENFQNELRQELMTAHSLKLDQGLSITLNGVPIESKFLALLDSDNIKSTNREFVYDGSSNAPLNVKVYAGMSERSLSDGGWYIFCNGRMILEADQSITTGWGEGDGKSIPKYHADFAYFRGYVFFDCDNAEKLPWTTTKTGVDTDSEKYHAVRIEMIKIMRPILDFLRRLAKESSQLDSENDELLLKGMVDNATNKKYTEIETRDIFVAPKIKSTLIKKLPPTGNIKYKKPKEQIEKIKKTLNVSTYKEVGEKTFEYFYKMECEE